MCRNHESSRRDVLRAGVLALGGLAALVPATGVRASSRAEGSTVVKTFTGRSGYGFDQWAYVPFDVPAGVRRISVRRTFEAFVVVPGLLSNVLDLGVFGPAGWEPGAEKGFRGWSGGARGEFALSATEATPGYLPGPIEPGTWAVALGPIVYNPAGMAWTVEVTLESGPEGPAFVPEPAPVSAKGRGPGWYRGDMHLHTVHSDGHRTPAELVAAARARGLDFFASTEHNTRSANLQWGRFAADDLLIISGEEVTTRHGHWLAIGLPHDTWIDWRYSPSDGLLPAYARAVRELGGLVVAAHPVVPGPGSVWEFGYDHVDAVEVWNGPWTLDDQAAVMVWDGLLREGRRLPAVGNSDSHSASDVVGLPQTVVHAGGLSRDAVLKAVREGRSYLADNAGIALHLTAGTALPGDTVPARTTVECTVTGTPGATLSLFTAAGKVAFALVPASGSARVSWTAAAGAKYVRAEVRSLKPGSTSLTTMAALSNPIWITG
ncbi:CehA/McbA family metallohydrolase [Actinocorallia longicatena]|uniref:CehA/McbA family metallohydrolase n=1 Tax=Actinocorallia longicatena TaxID=111803 RepID=A0ABP6PVJ1_9ACTN